MNGKALAFKILKKKKLKEIKKKRKKKKLNELMKKREQINHVNIFPTTIKVIRKRLVWEPKFALSIYV